MTSAGCLTTGLRSEATRGFSTLGSVDAGVGVGISVPGWRGSVISDDVPGTAVFGSDWKGEDGGRPKEER